MQANAIRSGSEGRIYIVQCTKTLSVVTLAKLFYRLQAFAQEMAKELQLPTKEKVPGTSSIHPLEAFRDKKLYLVAAARFIPAGKLTVTLLRLTPFPIVRQ